MLRLFQSQPVAPLPPARVVGIDKWAWKKGRTYGTIFVDLERKQPVDLPPDWEAKSVTSWLRTHPGVEIIARDRSGLHAEAALQGAPTAVQVADHFHILVRRIGASSIPFGERRG